MPTTPFQADLVCSGSGSLLWGFLGAIKALEEDNITFRYCAGTSGGSIVAALICAGYSSDEIFHLLQAVNTTKAKDFNWFWPINGLYKGNFIEQTIKTWLDAKHVRTFDAPALGGRLKIVTSDLTTNGLKVLDRPDLSVSRAVRASLSIPWVFTPVGLEGSTLEDGGITQAGSYPIGLFDFAPDCPTVGLKIYHPGEFAPHPLYTGWNPFKRIGSRLTAEYSLLYHLSANQHVADHEWLSRTIAIPDCAINSLNFALPQNDIETLYQAGYAAATLYKKNHVFIQNAVATSR